MLDHCSQCRAAEEGEPWIMENGSSLNSHLRLGQNDGKKNDRIKDREIHLITAMINPCCPDAV